jgi:hypothetical protein
MTLFSEILYWLGAAFAVIMNVSWIHGIRTYYKAGSGVTFVNARVGLFFFIFCVGAVLYGVHLWHLLWVLPALWAVSIFILPPRTFSLATFIYFRLCVLGVFEPYKPTLI